MAGTATPIFPQLVTNGFQQILPADTTTLKTLYTAGANGSKIEHISITSTDTANKDLQFYITSGGVDYLIATLQIPANSGNTNAIVPVDALTSTMFTFTSTDNNGNRYIYLASGSVLKVKATASVTAARVIQFYVFGGDF